MKKILLFLLLPLILFLSGCTNSNYSDYNYSSEDEDLITSDNWECTEDCSGHEVGYEWTEEKGITDSDDCGGNSNSFIEGCEAYTNEQELE